MRPYATCAAAGSPLGTKKTYALDSIAGPAFGRLARSAFRRQGLRWGVGRRGGGGRRRRRLLYILVKDVLFNGLQFGDLAPRLLLSGSELVNFLAHLGKIKRYRFHLLRLEKICGWHRCSGDGLRNGNRRCYPGKLRVGVRYDSSCRAAIGLPGQGGGNTGTKRYQIAGEDPRSRLSGRRLRGRWLNGPIVGELGPPSTHGTSLRFGWIDQQVTDV